MVHKPKTHSCDQENTLMARTMTTAILLSIVATTMLFDLALGVDHTVGGPGGGWDTATDLQAWASSETFTVGDNLVFTYNPSHDVVEVSKDSYDSCSTSNSISSNAASPTTIELTDVGSRYFICGTAGHCDQGMKVEIKTVAAASAPPTTTTPPSSGPPTTTTPPSSGPPTTTTPPSSGPPTTTTPPSSDSPAPPTSTRSPPTSGTPTPPVSTPGSPSSATTVKMSVVSMVGIGFLMMI